ncbi:MAG: Thiamine-phosphate synthase [Gammaproteobacteria bacterium]|nr:Thiamine-phosphate synthase [Gammaproteobacteria bacterium]
MTARNGAVRLPARGLYAITPAHCSDTRILLQAVEAAIRGGAVLVQYRAKRNAQRAQALALKQMCGEHGVPLIVNDDAALARDIDAAGVHLGRDDMGIAAARVLLGDRATVGVSCYDELQRAIEAERDGASYVAFGGFYPSRTKPGAVRASIGLLRRAADVLKVPIVAIGGITPENGGALLEAGAGLLAVIDGLFGGGDPEDAARRYATLFR